MNLSKRSQELLVSSLSCLVESADNTVEHPADCDCQFCLDMKSAKNLLQLVEAEQE